MAHKNLRLLLHAAAYWLLDIPRSKLVVSGVEKMQLDTLRLLLVMRIFPTKILLGTDGSQSSKLADALGVNPRELLEG